MPTVLARFDVAGRPLTVIGTHPVPPVSAKYVGYRDEQLALLARQATVTPGAVLLLGDLNMTSNMPTFGQFASASGLRDSRQGFGVQATWPSYMPPMRIAIDHCLVSGNVIVDGRRVGAHVGSDHFPVIVDVSLRD